MHDFYADLNDEPDPLIHTKSRNCDIYMVEIKEESRENTPNARVYWKKIL